jgi:hypothetical protein
MLGQGDLVGQPDIDVPHGTGLAKPGCVDPGQALPGQTFVLDSQGDHREGGGAVEPRPRKNPR